MSLSQTSKIARRALILSSAQVCAWAALGCGGNIVDLPPGLPDDGRVVRDVDVVGNNEVSEEDIAGGLETYPPEGRIFIKYNLFDPDAVAADRTRIESYYQKQGYFDAIVSEVETYPVRDNYIDVTFFVDEGLPTLIQSVAFGGVPGEPEGLEERVARTVELEVGERYQEEAYTQALKAIKLAVAEAGYPFVEVDGQVRVDKRQRLAAIRILVQSGPRVALAEADIVGTEYFPEETVAKRVAWEPGDIFTPELVNSTRKDILALDHFASVRVNLDNLESDITDQPSIIVRESKRNEIRTGAGFALDPTQFRVRARGGYRRRGFLSPLNTLNIDLRPAYAFAPPDLLQREGAPVITGFVGEAEVSVERIDFPVDFFRTRVFAGYQFDELESFTTQGPQVGINTIRRFFDKRLSVAAGWAFNLDRFATIRVTREALGVPPEDQSFFDQRVGYFDQTVALDLRDQILHPTEGFFGRIVLEEGTVAAGGEFTYLRLTGEARGYLNIWPNLFQGEKRPRLVAALRIGGGTDLLGDGLPVTRRFFAGGAASNRGFGQRTLAPAAQRVDADGNPADPARFLVVGGSTEFDSSFELRSTFYKNWGGVVFLDAADVVEEGESIDFGNLHLAAGFGARWYTPIGPVRADIGFRLTRRGAPPEDESPRAYSPSAGSFAFHLSLGEAF